MNVVEFQDVSSAYGGQPALIHVDLTVAEGEAVVLVGKSGAGKSTLLKMVNRLLVPTGGAVLVAGRDTRQWDAIELRRRTGYVMQHVGLLPHFTVEENVALVPRLQGWPAARRRDRARELLELVGLPAADYAGRWPHELSGGQQQRVGVARALAASPPVLLMDEPFGALDPVTRQDLRRAFATIRRDLNQTMLLVTHDMAEATALATRVGVLDGGDLIVCDTPDAVSHSPDPRVRRLFHDASPAKA